MLRQLRLMRLMLALAAGVMFAEPDGEGAGGPAGGGTEGGGDGAGGQADPPAETEAKWDDSTRAYIERLRGESAAGRTAKRDAETAVQTAAEKAAADEREKIAKALGLTDSPPDATQLAASVAEKDRDLASRDRTIKAQDRELAAWRAAQRAGVNAGALLDSRSFVAELAKLDPSKDDFGAQLDAAVKAAADANPHYRQTGQVPASGGADLNAGGSGVVVKKPPTLESAFAASMAPKP